MRPSDEKCRALVHASVRTLEEHAAVRVVDREAALAAVRRAVAEVLALRDEIDAAARAKIRSRSRPVTPGSREFADLYAQYTDQERRRRGL